MYKIAIDGPSGAGKSTLAKNIAAALGCVYVDTGAMYRTIGLFCIEHGIGIDEKERIRAALSDIQLDIKYYDNLQHMILCGRDVTGLIRTQQISMYASAVSAIPEVREFLIEPQRKFARENNVVMDGRDIGTVILPDADVKIFLTSTPEARAKRRFDELREKGEDVDYETIYKQTVERDRNDSSRAIAPLKAADDAISIDNSFYEPDQTFEEVLRVIKSILTEVAG